MRLVHALRLSRVLRLCVPAMMGLLFIRLPVAFGVGAPVITDFTPTLGPAGTQVVITGSGFTGASDITFNHIPALVYSVDSDSQITTVAPAWATNGKIRVTAPGGTAVSARKYTVAGSGQIAFESYRDGSPEIYLMNGSGYGETRITRDGQWNVEPSLSPNGDNIAFVSEKTGNAEIYLVNADGTGVTPLTANGADNDGPAFSPDGSQITFASDMSGYYQIYLMNSDGSGLMQLTDTMADNLQPAFSPDGSQIVFVSTRDGNGEIYLMNSNGTAQTRLTTSTAEESEPAFNPGGDQIAFVSDRDGLPQIYAMSTDGTKETRLTHQLHIRQLWDRLDKRR